MGTMQKNPELPPVTFFVGVVGVGEVGLESGGDNVICACSRYVDRNRFAASLLSWYLFGDNSLALSTNRSVINSSGILTS